MSIDVNTNGIALRLAVDSVLSGSYSWVVFGYVGLSCTLDVVNQGHDVEEMMDEFLPNRVMYGFASTKGARNGPLKFIFISWQGEGASEGSKLRYLKDSEVVKRLCRTTHLTIHARNDSDLDWSDWLNKISESYSLCGNGLTKQETLEYTEPKQVGSVYKRVDPSREISSISNSRNFWQSQQLKGQAISSTQLHAQTVSKSPTKFGVHQAVPSNNWKPNKTVDKKTTNGNHNYFSKANSTTDNVVTSGYKKIDPRAEIMLAKTLANSTSLDNEGVETVGSDYRRLDARAEIKAAQCNKSTHHLPSNKPLDTSAIPMDTKREIISISNTRAFWKSREQLQNSEASNHKSNLPYQRPDPLAEIKAAQAYKSAHHELFDVEPVGTKYEKVNIQAELGVARSTKSVDPYDDWNTDGISTPFSDTFTAQLDAIHSNTNAALKKDSSDHQQYIGNQSNSIKPSQDLKAVCLFDYTASENDEISFRIGDHIYNIQQIDEGWWIGETSNGQHGLFPANYVELIA